VKKHVNKNACFYLQALQNEQNRIRVSVAVWGFKIEPSCTDEKIFSPKWKGQSEMLIRARSIYGLYGDQEPILAAKHHCYL
jgi:hypothetical protein